MKDSERSKLEKDKKICEVYQKYESENKNKKWDNIAKELNEFYNENTGKETWRSRYRKLSNEYLISRRKSQSNYMFSKDKEQRLISYLKRERTIEFLCEMLDLDEISLLGNIEQLRNKGHDITYINNSYKMMNISQKETPKIDIQQPTSTIRFGVVSDTHFGNKFQQETLLKQAYEYFKSKGIEIVLHCGDISDGLSKRPEHIYELFALGADEQARYIINHYPKIDGITTYFLLGNHDGWHQKNGGINIGTLISNEREDMICLGYQQKDIFINNCKIRLFHPLDGSSYAISYSGQKTIDVMKGGDKPQIMLTGHHHKLGYFIYRNIHYFEVPCLEAATSFIQGKRLGNDVGYMIIEAEVDELGNVITLTPTITPIYETIENDYKLEMPKENQKLELKM